MSKTATVRARIESAFKADVEALLYQMGISTTEAIIMFFSQVRLRQVRLRQVRLRQGLPFLVKQTSISRRKISEWIAN